ncbi:hypothetical protein LAZ67_11002642, partial [Cordylochernes scorpioides]
MVETRSGKMQDPAQERIKAEESAKPQLGATIGGDASSDPVVLNPYIDIPKYDGTEDPRPWIESLEEIGFLYHWADYIIAHYAAMNMTGSAKTWLNLHKASFTSWENIKIRLIQDFSLDANKEELRMKLNRMQHWNEPAIRFAEDILVLCNKVDPAMEEETKIDHVIGGLKKEYSFALYLNPPKTTDELLVVCKKMDSFEKKYRERVEKSRNLYNGKRYSRPQQQSRYVPPNATRNYQTPSRPQAPVSNNYKNDFPPTPRQYRNNLTQPFTPRRPYNPNFVPKPNFQRNTYNKSQEVSKNRTEDGRPICFKCNKPGHVARYCRVKFIRILEEDPTATQEKIEEKCQMNEISDKSGPRLYADASIEAEDGEYVIEENNRMIQTNGLRLARSLLTVTDRKTHIWITNPYSRPLKIMKDQTLAHGSLPAEVKFIEKLERINNDEMQFQINKNLSPKEQEDLKQILIKVSPKERDIIKDQIDEMLKEGIIRPSSSPWSFPVILVKKRDGKFRFCVDYRKLNEVTVKDVYPIPRIDDVMDTLQGSKYFSAIDLRSGYWQVEIEEKDKEKTAFTTTHGLYEFNVMPFGLCNAPATFERNMDNVLGNLRWQICLCYLDDVIIYSSDFPTHLKRLEAVLKCFSESNLKLNDKKCRFAFEELEILGHITNQQVFLSVTVKMCFHFDPNAATYIHTDASNIGLGATLVQIICGEEKVISYLSRTLSKAEQNYLTTEKECLAVVWAISKLRPYLYGRHFKIITDHHALCWLKNLKDPTGRLARWALKIQEYDFDIIHKSGKKHMDADGLSRGPLPETDWVEDYERLFLNQIINEEDEFIENVKKSLKGSKRAITQNFKEENGCLYKKNPNPEGRAWLLVVPKKRRKEIMSEFHNHMLNGHLGVAKTTYRLKNKYHWPSMLKDVSEFVKTCHLCQSRKGSNQSPSGLLQPIPPANYPFERIGIDFVGPLPSTKRRRKWIIVLTDYYTRRHPDQRATDKQIINAQNIESELPSRRNTRKTTVLSVISKVRKCDLSKLAYELGEVIPPESRIVDLKHLILNSQSYEEEFAKQLLETLIKDRERIEERERIEDRKRIEDRERKEQMVMEFELEKLRIQTTRGNNDTSRSTSNDAHYEIRKLMPKYESKDNDLSFYLILFERQAKRLGLDEDQWAFSLLGLLPYEMTQLIARETEEQSGDYRFVKRLLLKRYKLSPEQFRQKFEKHERSQKGSWRDFAFELRGYFNEWIEGMNVENFDALKDLSVTNQLKKKVPNVLRNHLIDDWTKLNNPDELADKLDEYENVRTEMGPPHWNAKHLIPPSFQQKSARFPNQSEVKETKQGTNVSGQDAARNEISETYPNTLRRMVNRTIRNDKGEPKCFNCNQFGHIARDCPAPRTTLTCRGCGQTGHKERNCTRPKEGLKVANLEVEGLETVPPDVYLKDVKIDNKETVKAMIDTGSSSCLMRESVARRISVDIEPDSTSLYGIGNQTAPAARTVGKTTVDLEIDGIVGREITVFIVNDDAQPYDLLIGRTWTDLPYVSFARIGRVELLNLDDIVVNLDVAEDSFQTKNEEKREGQDQMKRKRPILPEDINVNHSLTSKERQEILDVVNEYRDCFALGMEELGCTDVTKMDIKEVDGSKPVCLRPYKTTASEREAIREIVREWKDNGIVTETRSPYASPVLLVRKKTGDHRLVVDYRRLNIQTVKDKFPLPRIDDLLEGLRNAKFFTTLDLAHGYLQIPLTDKAKLKTAFITPDDTGQFERMNFGLANAPAEFQRLMHTVLGPLLNKKAFCYLDDVIIPAKDWREMIERLREVLERIRSAKLTLKPSKCEFGRREVEFLGYVISTGGLKPGPRKIKAIEEFPEPKNVHDIRRFLGLTNFFRRFVKDFARKAEPLSRLTKKGSQFEWKEEQRRSFGGLRKDLVEYPVLAHYNPELKTEVHCDASAEGLAGMVLQMDEDVDPWTEPDRIQESVRSQIENKQEIMKTYYDKKRCRTIQFEVGEIVVMRHVPKMTGEPTKAQPKYRGPLIITEVLPSDTYRVTQLSERTSGRFYTTTAHISQLKSWHSEEDDSATEESPDEEPEVEDTPRRNPRRSCNARFNRGRLKSRNGR